MSDTMTTIRELKEKRAGVWSHVTEILDESRASGNGLEGERLEKYERAEKELVAHDKLIDAEERRWADERAASDAPQPSEEHRESEMSYDKAFRAYARFGQQGLSSEERDTLQRGQAGTADMSEAEKRALSAGTDSAGGYTVPEGFLAKITETQLMYNSVAEVANVITTATGNALPWPTNDDTANVGALLGENTQVTEQDVTFGVKQLDAYKYTSKLVRISLELMQDSAFDMESFLGRKFGERLGRIGNTHMTTGTGTAQPDGVVTGVTSGKVTSSATAFTYEEWIDLMHSVDPAYRGQARFMFSDLILAEVRKLRDDSGGSGLGRPLWEPSVVAGAPDLWLGKPYSINQDMATALAINAVAALYGDFKSYYVVRKVQGVSTIRLAERYADYLQVGMFAWERWDATKDDTSAVKALKMAAS